MQPEQVLHLTGNQLQISEHSLERRLSESIAETLYHFLKVKIDLTKVVLLILSTYIDT